MNKFTLEELSSITPILSQNNLDLDTVFDYVRIVAIGNKKYEVEAENPLYFLTYTPEHEMKDGWYIKPIDLRPFVNKIMKENPNYTFVIESNMVDQLENTDAKFIVVEDMHKTIDDLFNYQKDRCHAQTVAVTGSVGKTTCVGLMESILKQKYNVMRIYSKRITPLVLKANIINMLDDSIDYIVTENSIYYQDHVKVLADLLKPEIGCMLNIESSHLGVENLKTIDDICKFKAAIMQHAKHGYVAGGDQYLDKLDLKEGNLTYEGETLLQNDSLELEHVDMEKTRIEDESFVIGEDVKVSPFMLSELSRRQYTIAYKVAKQLGLTPEEITAGMQSYQPVENRLQKLQAFGKEIIFDGDITTFERMKELSDNMYENKYLVLRKVGSAENTFRIADIKEHFKKYKKVFIFDDVEYLDELKDEPNVEVVQDHNFMQELDGAIIYHYSGYYRVWEQYQQDNLNEYDREKYPIMKKK